MLIQNFLFHCVLGEVKVLIQNFLFHRILDEVKICASVSSRTGGNNCRYISIGVCFICTNTCHAQANMSFKCQGT